MDLPDELMPVRWRQPELFYHPIQKAYLESKARFRMLPCGRQSGKSELCKREVVRSLTRKNKLGRTSLYLCLGPTYTQAKKLWWDDLKSLIPPEWVTKYRESELTINVNILGRKSEVIIAGLDRPHRLEGKSYSQIWIDEYADIKPGAFDMSLRPAMALLEARATFLGVPKRFGVNGPDYRQLCEWGFDDSKPEYESFTWPSWDILTAEEVERIKQTTDDATFNEQYGAAWLTAGGTAFYNFDSAVHVVPLTYDPAKPILLATDFNVDPMCWTLSQWDGKVVRTFDELALRNTNTQAALNALCARYGSHKAGWHLFGDATGTARRSSASSSDYAQILNDKRLKPMSAHIPDANPGIRDRLASCNAALRTAAGEVKALVSPKCLFLIQDMKNRGIDATGLPTDRGDIGHMSDAWGYMVHMLLPAARIQGMSQVSIYNAPVIS